jgi:hypothetical protein
MKLEEMCTSLETSKVLAEMGFKRDCIFRRAIHKKGEATLNMSWYSSQLPAYTASELMEALPEWVQIIKQDITYLVCYKHNDNAVVRGNDNLMEALADMIFYCIDNRLI